MAAIDLEGYEVEEKDFGAKRKSSTVSEDVNLDENKISIREDPRAMTFDLNSLPDGSYSFAAFLASRDNYFVNQFDHSQFSSQNTSNFDFNNWFLKKMLGTGAYGKVFLITHKYTNKEGQLVFKDYALKVYKKEALIKA